jgi:predicted nucleic acid-binding protein
VTDLVVDASVAIKWVIDEPGTHQALSLRCNRLYAPDLLVAECANVLWKKVQRNELTAPEALIAARLLQRADLELMPMRALLEPATRLAIELGHPAYDCIYLALAESMTCDLVTADRELAAKPLPAGHDFRVLALAGSDFP